MTQTAASNIWNLCRTMRPLWLLAGFAVGCTGAAGDPGGPLAADGSVLGNRLDAGLDSGSAAIVEPCDQLDNNGNGLVDEGCECDTGASQGCYADLQAPTTGCSWGSQVCSGGNWGACSGAEYPAAGEQTCCNALGNTPVHEIYEAFLAAYPASALPANYPELEALLPSIEGHAMQYRALNSANEYVDRRVGGLAPENVLAGLAASRAAALESIPAGIVIASEQTSEVAYRVLRGSGNCNGDAWAWGSILYEADDGAVNEIVFMYVGYCEYVSEADKLDGEAFYYSVQASTVCEGPPVL